MSLASENRYVIHDHEPPPVVLVGVTSNNTTSDGRPSLNRNDDSQTPKGKIPACPADNDPSHTQSANTRQVDCRIDTNCRSASVGDNKKPMMHSTSFPRQLVALLKRNFLLKKRNKSSTIQEFFFPIYMVAILGIVRISVSPKEIPQVDEFPEQRLSTLSYLPISYMLASPDTPEVQQFMEDLNTSLPDKLQGYKIFTTWQEAELFHGENSSDVGAFMVGLDFTNGSLAQGEYKLRFPSASVPSTLQNNYYGSEGSCRDTDGLGSCPGNTYLLSGFIELQSAIDSLLIKRLTTIATFPAPDLMVRLMPKPEWMSSTVFVQTFSAIYLVLAYSVFVSFMLVAIVYEKEKGIKDAMKLMGLRPSVLWLSWMITYSVTIIIVTIVITVLAYLIKLFVQSNMGLVFLLLTLYGMSVICMSFMLAPFFKKADTAGGLGSLATTLFSLLYLAVALTRTGYDSAQGPVSSVPEVAQWFLCLLSPVALALGVDQALFLDISEGGFNTDNLWFGQFPVAGAFIMLAVDCVLYSLLALYFDNVIPDQFGQKRSPVFFLMPSYWCPRPRTDEEMANLMTASYSNENSASVEPVRSELAEKNVIRICDIKKTYKTKKKTMKAVDGISLDIYEGQITSILGHNGAGKTTLFNMLTGLTPPSSGTAFIYNLDVSHPAGQDDIHSMMGVCPQHNILLPDLTCLEHLELFAALKNVPEDLVQQQIKSALEDVHLMKEKETRADKLSGGQKRKLSLAIALIGNPRILVLDEPTAGMDPFSRRHVWSLLKDRCRDRVVLLTTHFMDEADILADRKAFMSKGRLKCAGSSLFLKNRFGLGYHISMVADVACDPEPITEMVQSHIPEATLNRTHGQEITYILPLNSMDNFPVLMKAVENEIEDGSLGISAYGVSMTSLEEVFLKIGVEELADDDDDDGTSVKDDEPLRTYQSMNVAQGNSQNNDCTVTYASPEDELATDKGNLTTEQLKGLCKVRFIHVYRNKLSLFFRIIMPLVFIITGIAIYQEIDPSTLEPTPLKLTASLYVNTSGSVENPDMVYQLSTPAGDPGSTDFIQELTAQGFKLTEINSQSELLQKRPNHAGINIYKMDTSSPDIVSNVSALYNTTATHSLPAVVNLISNTLIGMSVSTPVNITTYTFPWPDISTVGNPMANFGSTIILGLALVPTPAGMAVLIVRDRERKIRSQLRLTGVTHGMYWLTVLVTDLAQILGLALCAIIVVLAFQVEALITAGAMLSLSLVFLLYLPLLLILAYIISFAFKKFDVAASIMYNIFSITGILGYMTVSLLDISGLTQAATIAHYVLCIVDPPFVPIGILYLISKVYIVALTTRGYGAPIPMSDYFQWSSLIPYTILTAFIHYMWMPLVLRCLDIRSTGGNASEALPCVASKSKRTQVKDVPDSLRIRSHSDDSDVEEERKAIEDLLGERSEVRGAPFTQENRPVVQVHNLRKVFAESSKEKCCLRCGNNRKKDAKKAKTAVVRSSFMVKPGEVLGLLGPNGAGKTTTLNLITAEETPTRGSVSIAGYDISSNMSEAFQHLGFCPQHDALWDDITLREHMELYMSLRGFRSQSRKAVTNYYLKALRVEEHADKIAKKLSGGTKRKLSYAMSTVGKPDLVLMDEPSTGLDPKSKRFLWDTISSSFAGSSRGAILTTHYMEEADALCTRVAIMVNGQMMCIGSTQHLKNKYGSGYILEVKLQNAEQNDDLHAFITELFPDAERTENFSERATYKIAQSSIASLAHVFSTIENNKARLQIEDYSFSQSTLEQVFLQFAKSQMDDEDSEDMEDGHSSREQLAPV